MMIPVQMLKALLGNWGYQVVEAVNGLDALDIPQYGKEYSRAKKPAMKSSTRAKSSVSLQGVKG